MSNPSPDQAPPEQVWLTEELADRLRVSEPTIDRLVASGKLRPFYVGRSRRFTEAEVRRYITDSTRAVENLETEQ